jgi:hypothetical protein
MIFSQAWLTKLLSTDSIRTLEVISLFFALPNRDHIDGVDLIETIRSANYKNKIGFLVDLARWPQKIFFGQAKSGQNPTDDKDSSDQYYRFLANIMGDEDLEFGLDLVKEVFHHFTKGCISKLITETRSPLLGGDGVMGSDGNDFKDSWDLNPGGGDFVDTQLDFNKEKENSQALMKMIRGKRDLIEANFSEFAGYIDELASINFIEPLAELH